MAIGSLLHQRKYCVFNVSIVTDYFSELLERLVCCVYVTVLAIAFK